MDRRKKPKVMPMINNIYTMPQIDMLGGDCDSLLFTIKRPDGRPLDISTMTLKFSVINYSNQFGTPVLEFEKTGTPVFNDELKLKSDFKVDLKITDTIHLYGKYIYQISITDFQGDVKSLQGIIIITKNIATTI